MQSSGVRWDCHAHVIEDRYPLAPDREYDPPHAPLEDYLALLDRHDLARGVLVQPSVYGFDNRCLLDALDRAEGRLLGVAVPAPGTAPRQLEALHRRGVRGVRCNIVNAGGLQPDAVLPWQAVMRELGWHVALQVAVHTITDLRAYLDRFTVPVVIDHMGRPEPGRADPTAPGLRPLVERVAAGDCYVKLSAPYRLSNAAPPWPDVRPLARALVSANPARCLWATDWPHTQHTDDVSELDLFAAFDAWCPDAAGRQLVLETTPSALFGS